MLRARMSVAFAVLMLSAFSVSRVCGQEEDGLLAETFLQTIEKNERLSAQQRNEISTTAAEMKREGASDAEIVHVCLMELQPRFRRAMILLSDEETAAANKFLAELAESDDRYLAAESVFFLARSFVMHEDYEQALPLLKAVIGEHGEHSFRAMEVDFFTGVCQAHLLMRREAIATLRGFLKNHPTAAERMQTAARERLHQLVAIDEGTLADVQDRMEYVRRRLAIKESGRRTQDEQDNIIALLDKLIEPPQGPGPDGPPGPPKEPDPDGPKGPVPGPRTPGPSGGPNGNDGPEGDGATKGNPKQPSVPVRRTTRLNRDNWDHVREPQREAKALAALQAKCPERYAELVKQYFRSCAEGTWRELGE